MDIVGSFTWCTSRVRLGLGSVVRVRVRVGSLTWCTSRVRLGLGFVVRVRVRVSVRVRTSLSMVGSFTW